MVVEDRVCEQEAYDWYIFKVTVTKTELDTVARKNLQDMRITLLTMKHSLNHVEIWRSILAEAV